MDTKEILKSLNYEGYYDETGNFCININKEDAKEIIKRITGAKEVKFE